MLPGKLGRLENLPVQRYQQPFAELFILLELLEKPNLPFPDQIRLEPLKLRNLPGKQKFTKLMKRDKLTLPVLNQIKTRPLKMVKLGLLKSELLQKMQRLPVKLFLLTELELLLRMEMKLLLLTLSLPNLPSPKKIPPRRDGGGAARRHD
jgi:hypothetical protein